jgi:hypothetical protein
VRGLQWFHGTEPIIRLSSLIPSIFAVLLITQIVAIETRSIAIAFCAGVVAALCPLFIVYAKELKPYSFEVCIHLMLVLLAVVYIRKLQANRATTRDATILILATLAAAISAANVIFTLPGFYTAIGLWQYRVQKRLSAWLLISAVMIAAVIMAQYLFMWSKVTSDQGLMSFWSDSFYVGGVSRPAWIAGQLMNMLNTTFEDGLWSRIVPKWFWSAALAVLALIGVGKSVSVRNPELFFLFVSPVILVVLANAIGVWPLGPIRVDLFLFGFLILVVFMGLGLVCQWITPAPYLVALVALASYGASAFPFRLHTFEAWRPPYEDITGALNALADELGPNCSGPHIVIANSGSYHTILYYRLHHATFSPFFSSRIEKCAEIRYVGEIETEAHEFETAIAESLRSIPGIWIIYSRVNEPELEKLRDAARRYGRVKEHSFQRAGLLQVVSTANYSSSESVSP